MSASLSAVTGSFAPDLFRDRQVLVSGASSGIGLDLARGFRALGASVLATGSSAAKLTALHDDPNNEGIRFAQLDVRDAVAIRRTVDGLDRLDVLVNAAGIARPQEEYEPAAFLDVIDVNLNAAMRTAMAGREKLGRSGGCIVNYASMLSFLADADVPAYCASKTGLLGLTRALAHAFGAEGIRVNAIAPGYHKTDMTRPLWSQPRHHDAIARHSALKRWGSTVDLVGATVFLASPAAAFITGVCLPVDGGYGVGAATG
jgi:NAD(P)-dependent dehydrogenase (short-subunit alcohol dehydrogenase family)